MENPTVSSTDIQLGTPTYLYYLAKSNQEWGHKKGQPAPCPIGRAGAFLNNQVAMEWEGG